MGGGDGGSRGGCNSDSGGSGRRGGGSGGSGRRGGGGGGCRRGGCGSGGCGCDSGRRVLKLILYCSNLGKFKYTHIYTITPVRNMINIV
jgi:hypothetical protein